MQLRKRVHRKASKRSAPNLGLASEFARGLATARNYYQKGQCAEAYGVLNSLAGANLTPRQTAKIQLASAELEMRRAQYGTAILILSNNSLNTFATIGRVWYNIRFALVRAIYQSDPAWAQAQTSTNLADAAAVLGGSPGIGEGPRSIAYVLHQHASFFVRAGHIEYAAALLETPAYAGSVNDPRILSLRARIAYLSEDYPLASSLSLQAIQVGQLRAKTVRNVDVLVRSRMKQGLHNVPDSLWAALAQAPPFVRSRFKVRIVEELRRVNDSTWRARAQAWQSETKIASISPIYDQVLDFLELDHQQNSIGDLGAARLKATEILNRPSAAPREAVSAAVRLVKIATPGSEASVAASGLGTITSRYGAATAASARLRIGRLLGRSSAVSLLNVAKDLLLQNLPNQVGCESIRALSLLSLASIERNTGAPTAASSFYYAAIPALDAMVQSKSRSRRLTRAVLGWMSTRDTATDTGNVTTELSRIGTIVAQTTNYADCIDIARALIGGPTAAAQLTTQSYDKGKTLGVALFCDESASKVKRATALFSVCRLLREYGDDASILAIYDSQRFVFEDLEGANADFWSALSTVYFILHRNSRSVEARQMAEFQLSKADTSAVGYVILGTVHAAHLIRFVQSPGEALAIFRRVSELGGRHYNASVANYWLLLDAHRRNVPVLKSEALSRLRACFPANPPTTLMKSLVVKSVLIEFNMNVSIAAQRIDPSLIPFVDDCILQIGDELAMLNQ